MEDMKPSEADQITKSIDKLTARIDVMDERFKAMPDKAGVFTATFAVHALVWASVIATVGLTINILNIVGAFK
ncbi:hypothetical protein [Agrobacterium sp. CFBP2214]|uniref:hypothetical protein n=1 Tax=Agrobacterium sp. CFBP2214 TaxID=3040274 RepID=UPI000DD09CE0|nr:hypothetical protein [Agrobacterium sp. CFBP2214]